MSLHAAYFEAYKGIPKHLWLIFLALFINCLGSMALMFVALYFHSDFNFSVQEIGWLLSAFGIGFLIGGFLSSLFCEKIRAEYVIIFSLLISTCLFLTLPQLHTLFYIYTTLIFLGFSAAIVRPATNLVLLECTDKENRLRIAGVRRVAINLGVSLAGFIGGWLSVYGHSLIFYFTACASFASATILLISSKHFSFLAEKIDSTENIKKNISPWRDQIAILIVACTLLLVIVLFQIRGTYPLYLHEFYKMTSAQIGMLFAINGALIVLIEVPLLNFINRYNLVIIAAIGSLLICLGFAILPLGSSFYFAVLSCILWTLGEISFFPTTLTLFLNLIPQESKGPYMAMYQLPFSLSILLASYIGSSIYHYQHGDTLWFTCGVVGIVIVFGFCGIERLLTLRRV